MDFLVSSAFLGFGLWAFLVSRAPAGLILALFGIFYAVTNFQGPVFDALDEGVRYLQQNLSIFYTALLLHFFVVFPKPKSAFSRRIPGWMVYLPFLPFFTFGLAEWVVYPSGLRGYRSVAGFTDLFYMLLALVALIHTAVILKREERRESGFNLVLWDLAISFGPPLVLGLLSTVVPRFAVPGGEFLTLLGIAIPGSMALAVITGVRRAAERGL